MSSKICTLIQIDISRWVMFSELRAEAAEQGGQAGAVGVGDGGELEAEATAADVADDRVGADLSFGDEKIKLGGGADGALRGRLQEQAAEAHVADAREVVAAVGMPADPDVVVDDQARIDAA